MGNMNKILQKIVIVLLLFFSSVGFSLVTVSPLAPKISGDCTTERFFENLDSEKTLETVTNECSILPQAVAIVLMGVGLLLALYAFKTLDMVKLGLLGVFAAVLIFLALELSLYAFFQYNYFFSSASANTVKDIGISYLFAVTPLFSITLGLLVSKLSGQNVFNNG